MNETLNQEITDKVQDNQKATRECPHCHGKRIESMGYRDSTNTVRRYRCKNPDCKKSHSRDAKTGELLSDGLFMGADILRNEETIEILRKNQRANQTINIRETTKERFRNLKIYERETDDDILNRLLDEHYNNCKHLCPTHSVVPQC